MSHVVLTGPQQLDRRPDLLADCRGLGHEVVRQAAAESTARLHQMQRDRRLLDTAHLGGNRQSLRGRLARRPQFQPAILERGHAVLRLER
ncbi:hypothetical protein D3C83_83240 [compost metagenome]